ncbi:response regulator [Methylomagnum ishizawai]|uniref:response regulator n=1 Tax=Methylomagnum ishizawai TaxID=1760988 RepID=UPI001C330D4F|nr:response regulator [Methylomagnum ishizawai]BBL75268.1 response regulator [Methylomagnum ishizawai]
MTVKKILICDDSATDLARLQQVLHEAGHTLLTTTSGEEAVNRAKREQPDAIFLDIVMPGMDGFAVCRSLHTDQDTKHIPVVFVSTKHQKADQVWAKMQGAKGIVGKPYEGREILEILEML